MGDSKKGPLVLESSAPSSDNLFHLTVLPKRPNDCIQFSYSFFKKGTILYDCDCASSVRTYLQSTLDITKLWGQFFYKFKLLRVIWTCKKVSNAKFWLEKAIKMYFGFRQTLRDSQNSRYPSSRYQESTVFYS